jgi:hypothetical protein
MAAETPARPEFPVRRIVSGGQTGVDRGALDAALNLGVDHGGWCPLGRLAEDGYIPVRYRLKQCDSADYPVRTERNVLDSDGTLVLHGGDISGGTDFTCRVATRAGRPLLVLDLSNAPEVNTVRRWLREHRIEVLNVAGPRESTSPGIAEAARRFVEALLQTNEPEA